MYLTKTPRKRFLTNTQSFHFTVKDKLFFKSLGLVSFFLMFLKKSLMLTKAAYI